MIKRCGFTKFFQLRRGVPKHFRPDCAGTKNGNRNTKQLQFHAQCIGIPVQSALAHGINSGKRKRKERRQLACGDYKAASPAQKRKKDTVHQEDAEQIDAEDLLKRFFRHFHQGIQPIDPRLMHKSKQLVRRMSYHHLRRLSYALHIGHISRHRNHSRLRLLNLPIQSKNAKTKGNQPLHGCPSHPSVCPGHQNVFIPLPFRASSGKSFRRTECAMLFVFIVPQNPQGINRSSRIKRRFSHTLLLKPDLLSGAAERHIFPSFRILHKKDTIL